MSQTKSKLPTIPDIGKPKSERLDSIDALRAVAALAVGLYHVWGHDGTYPWPSIGVVTQSLHPHWLSFVDFPMRWGYLGVSLFLVLSGFCIHLPHARRKIRSGSYEFRPREFFLRRIWRLYPAYAVAVIFTALLLYAIQAFAGGKMHGHDVPAAFDLVTHLSFTHGYFEQTFYSIASVFWSLALEFQLYLLYPLFIWLFLKFGTGRAVVVLTIFSLAWRFYALHYLGNGLISIASAGPYVAMGSALARMPEWLFGAWLAERYVAHHAGNFQRLKFSRSSMAFVSVGFVAAGIASTLYEGAWVLTDILFGLAFCALVATTIFRRVPEQKLHSSRVYTWLAELGVISYSLYLFHLQFLWIIAPVSERLPGLLLPLFLRIVWLGVSIVIIRRIFAFVERPFLFTPKQDSKLYHFYQQLQKLAGIKTDTVPLTPASDFVA